jgi:hypothetical protein
MDFAHELRAARKVVYYTFTLILFLLPTAAMFAAFRYRGRTSKIAPALIALAGGMVYGFLGLDCWDRLNSESTNEDDKLSLIVYTSLCIVQGGASVIAILMAGYDAESYSNKSTSIFEKKN